MHGWVGQIAPATGVYILQIPFRVTIGIQGRIFVPHYFEQGKLLVPFEKYIPLYKLASITVCLFFKYLQV